MAKDTMTVFEDVRPGLRALRIVLLCALCGVLSACRPTASERDGGSGTTSSPPSPGGAGPGNAAASLATSALPVERQKYIWEIEHTAFELEKKFGSQFGAALKDRDPQELQEFCLPDLSATILDSAKRVTTDHGFLRQANADPDAEIQADTARLLSHLCGYLDGFAEVGKIKFRVLDLHADDRRPESGKWSLTLYLTGIGKNDLGAPIEFETRHRLRCNFRGDEEIAAGKVIAEWRVLEEKFRSASGPLFEEVTSATGLDQVDIRDNWKSPVESVSQYYTQMAVEDFDRDGYLDVAIASVNGRWRLLKSIEGRAYRDVTSAMGLPPWADEQPRSRSLRDNVFLATWIDADNDSFPDLLLGDRLYRNVGGKSFDDATEASGLKFGYQPKGCVVADYDCDGWLDLYVLYQLERGAEGHGGSGWIEDDTSGAENQLWRNTGKGQFVNVTATAQAGGGRRQSFAAAWLHANGDRYPDLYVANDFGTNVLLINEGNGRFRDVSQESGVADYGTSMGVATGDVTGDGAPEIYVANMFSKMGRRIIAHVGAHDYPPGVFRQIQGACAGNRLYSPGAEGGKYRETSEQVGVNQVGWAYAPALADFDADGWLDIYATAGFLSFHRDKPDG